MSLESNFKLVKEEIAQVAAKRRVLLEEINSVKQKSRTLKGTIKLNERAATLLSYIVEEKHGSIVELFQHTISSALKDIFDDSYDFQFVFKKRGTLSTCEYEITNGDYGGWTNLRMCHGKSVCEIIAIILRIILVKIDKESPDIVICDEPLSGLEPDRQQVAGKFLSDVCKKFGIQLIMVSHSENVAIHADKIIEISR